MICSITIMSLTHYIYIISNYLVHATEWSALLFNFYLKLSPDLLPLTSIVVQWAYYQTYNKVLTVWLLVNVLELETRVRTVHEKTDPVPEFSSTISADSGPDSELIRLPGHSRKIVRKRGNSLQMSECVTWYLTALQSPAPGDRPTDRPSTLTMLY